MDSPLLNPAGYMLGLTALMFMTGIISFALVQLQAAWKVLKSSTLFKKRIHQQSRWWDVPLLSLIGIGIAGYLTWAKSNGVAVFCGQPGTLLGDCNVLLNSEYAKVGEFPIAVLGLIAFGSIGALWFLQRSRRTWLANGATLGLLIVPFIALIFSMYLSYIEVFVLNAICIWCLLSALTISGIMILVVNEIAKEAEVIDN